MRPVFYTILFVITACTFGCSQKKKTSNDEIPKLLTDKKDTIIPKTFEEEMGNNLENLKNEPTYGVLNSIQPMDLYSYLTGHLGTEHIFPILLFEPKARTITLSYLKFQETYPIQKIDQVLKTYTSILIYEGFVINGKNADNTTNFWFEGKNLSYDKINELLLNSESRSDSKHRLTSKFSETQNEFLHNHRPYTLITYLSGYTGTPHDYPLISGLDPRNDPRIGLFTKDKIRIFTLDKVDSAFTVYKKYIESRK